MSDTTPTKIYNIRGLLHGKPILRTVEAVDAHTALTLSGLAGPGTAIHGLELVEADQTPTTT